MPEIGKYKKTPRPESIDLFLKYLSSISVVNNIQHLDNQVIIIQRNDKSNLKVFMTNIYIIGMADVFEILHLVPDIQAIVTMSAWNSYTQEAKDHCINQKIGLFKFKEFLGAVYFEGKKFIYYAPPKDHN